MGAANGKPGAHLGVCRSKAGTFQPQPRGAEVQQLSTENKVKISDLPEVTVPTPSQDTLDDLTFAKGWKQVPELGHSDIVTVKQAWNRIIAWKDATMEALVYKWVQLSPEVYDQLRHKFDELPLDMFLLIDSAVRALDERTEVHHRESYTAGFPSCCKREFGNNPNEIIMHYLFLGIRPHQWATLKQAFLFAMRTHNPYMYEDHDKKDLDKGDRGALARFFHTHIVGAACAHLEKIVQRLMGRGAHLVHRQAKCLSKHENIGELFYRRLLKKYPELLDYFANSDMDHLSQHLQQTVAFVATSGVRVRDAMAACQRLSVIHRQAMIPTFGFPLVGEVLLETVASTLEMAPEIVESWKFLYMMTATIIQSPMAVEERLYADAEEFFQTLARDEDWPPATLSARLKKVAVEIALTGTYRHTSEEIQAGARIAWRNSPKCIGRISWDTLVVRDSRHITDARKMMLDCHEHLKLATCKENITAVMTVFAPKKPNEKWGTRFWNSQFVRFAAYEQPDGSIMGDPANLEFTKLVMEKFGWVPPEPRGKFDCLPQVIDVPGRGPQMFEFPKELVHLVNMEHPRYPDFAKLGLKWCAVPAITAFNMRIGGVDYPCCPFNGWFVDLEIGRNLVERYNVGPEVARICGYDTSSDATGWRSKVIADVCHAVTHSFRKAKFSIVDHYTCSQQFLTHVDREHEAGREVPAQWSWIGGFAGVHCPVWHYEMRDFYLRPQYHYCCEKYVVVGSGDADEAIEAESTGDANEVQEGPNKRVLILYASETGTAERFAKRMYHEIGLAYRPRVADLNSLSEEMVARYTHILLFVSTFGNGGPPKNGEALPDKLPFALKNPKTGEKIKFALMAFGSSIYPKFCAFGKKVEKVMLAAGGEPLMSSIWADEVKSQPEAFNNFLQAVRVEVPPAQPPPDMPEPVLQLRLGTKGPALDTRMSLQAAEPSTGHRVARVVHTEELLTSPDPGRSTRRIDIDISECDGLSYHTGGHLSVFPANPDSEVQLLCKELELDNKMHSTIQAVMVEGEDEYPASLHFKPTTIFEMFKWHYDIKVKPSNVDDILDMILSVGGMTKNQRKVLGDEDKDQLVRSFWWVSRVLQRFPACRGKITLENLVGKLSRQVPRLYSIASSNIANPKVVSLCVGLVHVEGNRGLCSGFLHNMKEGDGVLVATRDSSFQLPDSPSAPVIMVGPGTGLAPFIGFLQERLGMSSRDGGDVFGDARLFFGCRTTNEILHKDLCEEATRCQALKLYSVSMSRQPGAPKCYVHDSLVKDGEALWRCLQDPNCHYYVCGDARMADSAYESLLTVIQKHGKVSRAKAVAIIDGMRCTDRYHLDVWGLVLHFQNAKTFTQIKAASKANEWLTNFTEEFVEG